MSVFDVERQKPFEEEENLKIKVFAKYHLVSLKYSGEPRIPTPQVNQTDQNHHDAPKVARMCPQGGNECKSVNFFAPSLHTDNSPS